MLIDSVGMSEEQHVEDSYLLPTNLPVVVDNVEAIIPNVDLLTKLGGRDASAYY